MNIDIEKKKGKKYEPDVEMTNLKIVSE